jgi:hypothetical protein
MLLHVGSLDAWEFVGHLEVHVSVLKRVLCDGAGVAEFDDVSVEPGRHGVAGTIDKGCHWKGIK